MTNKLSNISLREKKFARTKLSILEFFIKRLRQDKLIDISIKELANELEISEKTFFNYFNNKEEVLIYYIQLWNISMFIKTKLIKSNSSIEKIRLIFIETARMIQNDFQLTRQVISQIALSDKFKKNLSITKAELLLKFGSTEDYNNGGIEELLKPLLIKAQKNKEISLNADIDIMYINLYSIFFGVPLYLNISTVDKLKNIYLQQLDILFKPM